MRWREFRRWWLGLRAKFCDIEMGLCPLPSQDGRLELQRLMEEAGSGSPQGCPRPRRPL